MKLSVQKESVSRHVDETDIIAMWAAERHAKTGTHWLKQGIPGKHIQHHLDEWDVIVRMAKH